MIQILENCSEFGIEKHSLFVDFNAAYDRSGKCNLYTVIEEFQITEKLIALVKITMKNTQRQIKTQNMLSGSIHIKMISHKNDALACRCSAWQLIGPQERLELFFTYRFRS
jgi:hypothetical protein